MIRVLALCLLLAGCTNTAETQKALPPYNATNASNTGTP